MKKNRVLSAVLAVMMLISMIACITVPAVAEQAYALTQAEAEALPSVSTATMDDGVRSYKIASWADMIYFASMDRYQTTTAYQESAYAGANGQAATKKPYYYGTAQINDGSSQKVMGKVEYTNPAFVDQDRFDRTDISTFDRVYLTVDLNVADYVGESGSGLAAFQADFDHFLAPNTASGYANSCMDLIFDGLGHTITGYEDTDAFVAGQWTGIFRNVTFKNVNVTSAAGYGSAIIKAFNDGIGNTVENVHIMDSVYTNSTKQVGGFILGLANNNNRPVMFRNCSVQNSRVIGTHTDAAVDFAGLMTGLQYGPQVASNKCPGAAECVQGYENCILLNSSITVPAFNASKDCGGLLIGKFGGEAKSALSFKNIAVYNCSINATAATAAAATASVLGYVYGGSNTSENNGVSNIFAAKVTQSYSDGNGGAVTVPVSQFVMDRGSSWSSLDAVKNATCVSDGTISVGVNSATDDYDTTATVAAEGANYNILNMLADMNASSSYSDWTLDANGNVVLLAADETAPKIVTFTDTEGVVATFATDDAGKLAKVVNAEGKVVAVDASAIAALSENAWKAENSSVVPAGTDWSAMTFTADVDYANYSHTLGYVPAGEKKHDVTCSADGCVEHVASNVDCTPVAVPENDVAASYFAKAKKAYKCEFCTNTWFEEVVDSTYDAPYSVAFDAAEYMNNDAAVVVTVTPKVDANMTAMSLELTFPAEYLTYVDYAVAEGLVVNESAAGTLTIATTAPAPITLNFKVKGLGDSVAAADLVVNATLVQATVGTGNEFAAVDALTKTASAEADAIYLNFKAGDVNNDDAVDLVDAVLLVQKLNGTIGSIFDANFQLIAADVNGDGSADTADITMILQYICKMDVTLVPATSEPTIVVVTA